MQLPFPVSFTEGFCEKGTIEYLKNKDHRGSINFLREMLTSHLYMNGDCYLSKKLMLSSVILILEILYCSFLTEAFC